MPMGAGPYKFVKYENRVVYYEANDLYYKGAPLTKYFQFKETNSADVIPGITTATIDASELNGTKTNFESIMALNSNGEITGDVITTSKVDNRGYGYIGMNAREHQRRRRGRLRSVQEPSQSPRDGARHPPRHRV